MKNFLLACSFTFGIAVTTASAYWGVTDMNQLNKAYQLSDGRAELRHRLNVMADGTWLLLGNIISVISLCGMNKTKDR